MDDIDRVLHIAKRYDVAVFLSEDFPRGYGQHEHEVDGKDPRGLKKAPLTEDAGEGPRWHHCDPDNRIVWFDNLDPLEVETHLHEVCHCIIQPPEGVDQLSEDVLLMPFERTLARQVLSLGGYKRVTCWQEGTQIEWWDARSGKYYGSLCDVPNYAHWGLWRESFRALRRMGALKDRKVTWRRPNWNRAPKSLMARGNLI